MLSFAIAKRLHFRNSEESIIKGEGTRLAIMDEGNSPFRLIWFERMCRRGEYQY